MEYGNSILGKNLEESNDIIGYLNIQDSILNTKSNEILDSL